MTAADDDRRAEKFVDVRRSDNWDGVLWHISIWRLGGNINGSAQPFKVLDVYECTEFQVAYVIENYQSDTKLAPLPTMVDGRLYVYDVSFRGPTP